MFENISLMLEGTEETEGKRILNNGLFRQPSIVLHNWRMKVK